MQSPDNRIFQYHNGTALVWADPFEIDYAFMKASEKEDMKTTDSWLRGLPRDEDGNINADDPNWRLHWRNYAEACHRYVPMIRQAFGLEPFDPETGKGLTANAVMRIWIEYQDWKADVKKNTEPQPTSATPMDSARTSSPGQWTLKPGMAST